MHLRQRAVEQRPQNKKGIFNFKYLMAKNAVHLGIKLEAKGLFLDIAVSTDTPRYFHGDPRLVEKILRSIVRHSMNYLNSGGITIRIIPLDFSSQGNQRLLITINESSQGMMPEEVQAINQSLQKQKKKETPSISSPLRHAANLIQILGGHLAVESDFGWGTRYLVTLNLCEAGPVAACC